MRKLTELALVLLSLTGFLLLNGCATQVESLASSHAKGDVAKVGQNLVEPSRNVDVRRKAADLLKDFPVGDALPYLTTGANDSNSRVRSQVAKTLAGYDSPQVVPILKSMVNDSSSKVKSYALAGLGGKIDASDSNTIRMVRSYLRSESNELRLAASEFFAKMGMDEGHKETIALLDATYFSDVRRAIQTLKYYESEEDISYLQKFLVAKDRVTRELALQSIEFITGGKLNLAEIDALRSDAQNLSMALATGQATTIGERPSIYVAYPPRNERIAEDAVDVIAYVKSDNRTQKMEVRVNNEIVPVSSLWADYDVNYQGLRGFPLRWRVPLPRVGENIIDINVTDRQGFLVSERLSVVRIRLADEGGGMSRRQPQQVALLAARLDNIEKGTAEQEITPENFMAILGNWVKDTSYSDYNKGNSMLDQGRYERASYYYNRAIKTNAFGEAYFNLGLSVDAEGKHAVAQDSFRIACGMDISRACELSG